MTDFMFGVLSLFSDTLSAMLAVPALAVLLASLLMAVAAGLVLLLTDAAGFA